MSTASDSQFLVDLAWEMENQALEKLAEARALGAIGNRISDQSGQLVPTCVAKELTAELKKQRSGK